MTSTEYKQKIEKIYGWEINSRMLDMFIDLAKETGSGKSVLDDWQTFQDKQPGRSPDSFLEWWENVNGTGKKVDHVSKKKTVSGGLGIVQGLPWRD